MDGMKLTNEQLSALPEFQDYEIETLPNGSTIKYRKVPKFIAHKFDEDAVILFNDSEGSWVVDYGFEGGPYKRRFYL